MKRIIAFVAVGVVVVSGAVAAFGQTANPASAWIDKPLGWVTIHDSPVGILAHVADPAGVGKAAFAVDGRVVDEVDTAGATLEVVEFSWSPEESGIYELRVTGFDTAGNRGGESSITVVVDLETPDTTTTTSTTSSTTTPTTAGTTTSTCSIGTPTATGPTGTVTTDMPTLTWTYSGCEPEYFEVQIADVPDFGSIWASEYVASPGRQWTVTVHPLENCDTFYWRVRRWEEAGVGPWSNVGTFDVSC
jgi:hypothetical protein